MGVGPAVIGVAVVGAGGCDWLLVGAEGVGVMGAAGTGFADATGAGFAGATGASVAGGREVTAAGVVVAAFGLRFGRKDGPRGGRGG